MAVIQRAAQTIPSRRARPFIGGGTDGNERLTAIVGVVLLIAVGFILSNLVVDIVYGWLDPRIRYSS